MERRTFLLSSIITTLTASVAEASPIDPSQTVVLQQPNLNFSAWQNYRSGVGRFVKLCGDLDKPGPYLALMKWNPGWFASQLCNRPYPSCDLRHLVGQ